MAKAIMFDDLRFGFLCEGRFRTDVHLVVVIQAWPYLPEAIRAGILALVSAAS